MGTLSHEEILEVRAVAVALCLQEERAALLCGINVEMVATLPRDEVPGAQILRDL